MERLVAGRERIYLDRFWNEFSATPGRFSEAAREHYAKLYAQPGAMHSGFMQFAAFDQDALDNSAFLAKGKLAMPVLALGGHVRRRDGALFWEHFTDTADPMRHVETFIAENWTEHLRQHERVTLADRALEEELRAFQVGDNAPIVTHLVGARTRL